MNPRTFTLAATATLASCHIGPDFLHPNLDPGTRWKENSASHGQPLPDAWWTCFHDRDLNRLIDRVSTANHDLDAAKSRVDTARALVGLDRSRLFPQLGLSANTSGSRSSAGTSTSFNGSLPNLQNEHYQAAAALSYEPDLWGRNRRQLEASAADADAAAADLDTLRLGLAAETARQYFLLRALDDQHNIVTDTIQSRKDTLDLQLSKAGAGLADGMTTASARTQLELARNDLANVDRQRASAEHALAVLCGARPADFHIPPAPAANQSSIPDIRPGLPADVLRRRPDLRAAENRLRAANARVGLAMTSFYPNFTLVGSGGFQSLSAPTFLNWENRALAIGLDAAMPLADGGANAARKAAADAQYQTTLANYRQTLLTSLREVEDSLADLHSLANSRAALDAALVSARESLELTRDRHNKGLASYLEVVDADRTTLQIRLALSQVAGQQHVSLANLAKALGGGWAAR